MARRRKRRTRAPVMPAAAASKPVSPRGRLAALFKPQYHELTTYLATLTCVLLFLFRPELPEWFARMVSSKDFGPAWWWFMLASAAAGGVAFSFFNVLVRRKKPEYEKTAMAALTMGANGAAGVACGLELMPHGWTLAAVFPAWNVVTGLALLYQLGLADDESVTDEEAWPTDVALSTAVLLVVFASCQWGFKLSWAMTFSICMTYVSLFGAALDEIRRRLLGKEPN